MSQRLSGFKTFRGENMSGIKTFEEIKVGGSIISHSMRYAGDTALVAESESSFA